MSLEQLIPPFRSGYHEDHPGNEGDESRVEGRAATGTGGKRKYRRHPKVSTFLVDMLRAFSNFQHLANNTCYSQADENAPERPPSAYVIFSNSERRHSITKIFTDGHQKYEKN